MRYRCFRKKYFPIKFISCFTFLFLQSITEIEQVQGDWWVVKGQNCGQEGWPGAFDWYPCQHGRFIQVEDRGWINNTTYCAGQDSVCTSDILVTIPDAELTSPGVTTLDYPPGEAPVLPQVRFCRKKWRQLSMDLWLQQQHPNHPFLVG